MQNKVVIFDVDHTLFNTDKYLEQIFISLTEVFPNKTQEEIMIIGKEAYKNLRAVDVFSPNKYANMLRDYLHKNINTEKVVKLIEDPALLASCIYPDVRSTLEKLAKENITLAIFSTGDKDLQLRKVRSIGPYFQENDIHIYLLKDIEVPTLVSQYKNSNMYVIDDHVRVLAQFAKQEIPSVKIWIDRPSVEHFSKDNDLVTPDYRITTIAEIVDILGPFDK